MFNKVEVQGAWWKRNSDSLSDNDLNNIRLFLDRFYNLSSEKNVPRAVDILAHQNEYHPIRDYLNSLKWDGINRIENLLPKYLGGR